MKKILLIILVFMMSGCFNYKELNDIAIISSIAVDKFESVYEVSIAYSNQEKNNENVIYSGIGKTFYEAYMDLSQKVSKQIYIGHTEILILSESAFEDSSNIFDFLFSSPESRGDFYIAVAKDCNAKDIIKSKSLLDNITNQSVAKNLKISSNQLSSIYYVTFTDFIKNTMDPGINPVLPSVEIEDDIVKLNYMALFKKNKLVTFSNEQESTGINIINNKVKKGYISIDYNDSKIVSKIDKLNTNITFKDNYFIVNVNIDASIIETNNIELNEINLENIKNKNIEEIKKMMDSAIKISKDNKTDIFGFGNVLYKNDLKKWNNVKDNWDEIYPSISIKYNIKLDLKTKDSINI